MDARREDDPPFDGFLRLAVPFVAAGLSQTVVSVVPGVLDLGVDDVGVLEATALVEEKTRAKARTYVSVQSLSTSKREKERQKCVPNRSSFLLRVIKGVFCVLLLLLLLFARIILRLKSRRLSRRLRRRTFCRLFPSVRPRSSSKLVLVSMWRLCLSIYTGRSCCLCRSSLSSSSSSSSSSFSLSSRF